MDLARMPYPACTIAPLPCPSHPSGYKLVQKQDALSTPTGQHRSSPSHLPTVWNHPALEAYINPTGQKPSVATQSTTAGESEADTKTEAVQTTRTVTPLKTTKPSATSQASPPTPETNPSFGECFYGGEGASVERGVGETRADAEPLRLRTPNHESDTHTPAAGHTRSTNPDPDPEALEAPEATKRPRTELSKHARRTKIKHGSSTPGCIQRSSAPCTTPDGRTTPSIAAQGTFTDWVMVDDTEAIGTQPSAPGTVEGVDIDAEWDWEEVEVEMEVEVQVETEDEIEIVDIKTETRNGRPHCAGLAMLGLPTQ